MKPTSRALLFYACLVSLPLFAQHQHVAPIITQGDQIPDNRAWLMELIASTSSPGDSAGVKHQADIHGRWLDQTITSDFRTRFDQLTQTYNAALSDGKQGTTPADLALRDQFFLDVEELLGATVSQLQQGMSPTAWAEANRLLQEHKAKMTHADDAPSAAAAQAAIALAVYHPGDGHLVRTEIVLGAYAAAGYTTYTELATDGVKWYQTVHLYGASTGQWTCSWNPVRGEFEPAGCPAHHDFYTSNQINGGGYTNYYETTEWNPASYVLINHEFDTPVGPNNGSETAYTDASVDCSVAGSLMGPSYDKVFDYIKRGKTYEQWDNSVGKSGGGNTTCGLYPVCSNPGPYLVDIPYTFANVNGCSRGYSCNSLCASAPGYPWVCWGNDPTKTLCFGLTNGAPFNPKQNCDPHP